MLIRLASATLCITLALVGCNDVTQEGTIASGSCGDGVCSGEESVENCPQDCTCGDGVCAADENQETCAIDCTATCSDSEIKGAELPYLWVANSPEGTVSKIDTANAIEVARYRTAELSGSDPSRTSVSIDGRYAVVVNRSGSITNFAANEEDCVDRNGNGVIDTSKSSAPLAWQEDECMIWHQPLGGSGTTGPRPVGWTLTEVNLSTCTYEDGDVWVGWYDGFDGVFRLLDGQTGATLDEIRTPWSGESYGPYGGAIDSQNNFWVIGWASGPLIKIDATTHQVTNYGAPQVASLWTYGMSIAPNGRIQVASGIGYVEEFDPVSESWLPSIPIAGNPTLRGLMVDAEGMAWIATNGPCGVAKYNTATRQVVSPLIELPGCSIPVGVSIDADGYVWVVDQGSSVAFKIHPTTHQIERTVGGLVSPYTYSDMTGSALRLQDNPIVQ